MTEVDWAIVIVSIYAAVGYWKLREGVRYLQRIDESLQALRERVAPDDEGDLQ